MKKYILGTVFCIFGAVGQVWAASTEQYVEAVQQVTEKYKQDRRDFFATLSPEIQQFTASENQKYCAIVGHYIDGLYHAADQNRQYLDGKYRQISYQDVVHQVMESKDMQLLKRYQVKCNF